MQLSLKKHKIDIIAKNYLVQIRETVRTQSGQETRVFLYRPRKTDLYVSLNRLTETKWQKTKNPALADWMSYGDILHI